MGDWQANKRLGVLAVLVATTGMGLSGLLGRGATRVDLFGTQLVAGESIGAVMTVGRMAMGLLLFLAVMLATKRGGLFRATKLSPSIVVGGLCVGTALALYLTAAAMTSIANAIFLIYTGPLFCTILARVFRNERPSGFQWGCLGAVFVGMLFTSGIVAYSIDSGFYMGLSLSSSTPEYPNKGLGDALGLLAGVFYGVSLFCNGYRKDCDVAVRGVWNFLFGTVGAALVTVAMMGIWPLGEVSMQPANWAWAVALWVICGPIGVGFMVIAARHLPAVEYSTISYWECVVALLTSVLVFHEPFTLGTIAGGALIVVGGLLPALTSLRKA